MSMRLLLGEKNANVSGDVRRCRVRIVPTRRLSVSLSPPGDLLRHHVGLGVACLAVPLRGSVIRSCPQPGNRFQFEGDKGTEVGAVRIDEGKHDDLAPCMRHFKWPAVLIRQGKIRCGPRSGKNVADEHHWTTMLPVMYVWIEQ